ncbi:MAG: ThuA domain-containing protein [Anaerolineae bacterium]|nr:ThuA domain-containing protein [Anaerolineae bacterium]
MTNPVRVTIWNEYRSEREREDVRAVYPDGMHAPIAGFLRQNGLDVRVATFDEPEHGLTEAALAETDVLIWWGYTVHEQVADAVVDRIQQRVLQGMGLIALHSAHYSKIFRRLMGTSGSLNWRDVGEKERIWVIAQGHPIARGLGDYFEIPHSEAYCEPFDIPPPDELVFVSWYAGGDVFRSGCCYRRGRGKVFYFSPGDQVYPIYFQKEILQVILNAALWATPNAIKPITSMERLPALEDLEP